MPEMLQAMVQLGFAPVLLTYVLFDQSKRVSAIELKLETMQIQTNNKLDMLIKSIDEIKNDRTHP